MKKIGKKICVSVLACVGLFTLTGCKQDLSEEQIGKIMYLADNADVYMDESLNLLEKSNNKLNLEEAYKLFKLAQISFSSNLDGVRNNMTVVTVQGNKTSTGYYLYVPMGDYIYYVNYDKVEENTTMEVVYRLNGKVYTYENNNGTKTKVEVTDCATVDAYLTNSLRFDVLGGVNVGQEDLLKVEVLDNGNYHVVFGLEVEGSGASKIIIQYEITPDAKFINASYNSSTIYEQEGVNHVKNQSWKQSYTYDEVTESTVLGPVTEAKAFTAE